MKALPPPKNLRVIEADCEEGISLLEYNQLLRKHNGQKFFKWVFFLLACVGLGGLGISMHTDWAMMRWEVAQRFLAMDQLEAKEKDANYRTTSPCGHDRFERENLDWTIIKAIAKDESPFKRGVN